MLINNRKVSTNKVGSFQSLSTGAFGYSLFSLMFNTVSIISIVWLYAQWLLIKKKKWVNGKLRNKCLENIVNCYAQNTNWFID